MNKTTKGFILGCAVGAVVYHVAIASGMSQKGAL